MPPTPRSCSARQTPLNVTTAPMSVRPAVSAAISRATSKSASWMRMVIEGVMTVSSGNGVSAAGHRRKQCDFAGAGDRRLLPDVGMVDGGADHPGRLEGVGVFVAARRKPADQVTDRAHLGR